MSAKEIDEYLKSVPEPQRSSLQEVRDRILALIPDCEQGISYGLPAFIVRGKVMAGFAAGKSFNSYYPHSGAVFELLEKDLVKFERTKGALHFPKDKPLSKALLKKLIDTKYVLAFGEVHLKGKPDPDELWRSHGLAAPARRALIGAGVLKESDLKKLKVGQLEQLHGIGPRALKTLKELSGKG
jgi:uncharacterized protein YdhG (YjbR/CyaY superfamily)